MARGNGSDLRNRILKVTALEPVFEVSRVSVAVTVMALGEGGNSGAVYSPVAEIVPMVELPPAMPLTLNVSRIEPSFVVAMNCWLVSPGSWRSRDDVDRITRGGPRG